MTVFHFFLLCRMLRWHQTASGLPPPLFFLSKNYLLELFPIKYIEELY